VKTSELFSFPVGSLLGKWVPSRIFLVRAADVAKKLCRSDRIEEKKKLGQSFRIKKKKQNLEKNEKVGQRNNSVIF